MSPHCVSCPRGAEGFVDVGEVVGDARRRRCGPACLIVEVCDPVQAKKVLEADTTISTALPCRISIYEDGDKVKVATLRPTVVLDLFGNPELEPVARSVEDTIISIIESACE